jgi:hypothetical protein
VELVVLLHGSGDSGTRPSPEAVSLMPLKDLLQLVREWVTPYINHLLTIRMGGK